VAQAVQCRRFPTEGQSGKHNDSGIGGPFKERSCEAVKELLGKIWAVAGQPEGGLFAFKSISHSKASRDET